MAGPLQPPQHLEIGLSGGRDEILIGNVGDRDETDMTILAVECAAGQRFVEVLKPVGADKIRVNRDGAQIAGIGRAAFALTADADEPLPKQPAIGRAELDSPISAGLSSA